MEEREAAPGFILHPPKHRAPWRTQSIITFGHERLPGNFPFFFLCSQVYVFQASVEPDSSYPLTPALRMITACGSQFPISKAFSSLHQEPHFPFAAKSQGQAIIASSKHAWALFAISTSAQPLTCTCFSISSSKFYSGT